MHWDPWGMGHMLTPLAPNLLAAVCLFFECSHSPACFFNYTLPCVLSAYITQNEMHLENIKITNAHHYSHNFNLAWYFFWSWLCFILCFINSFPNGHLPSSARESHINCSKWIILSHSWTSGSYILSQREKFLLSLSHWVWWRKYSFNSHNVTSPCTSWVFRNANPLQA